VIAVRQHDRPEKPMPATAAQRDPTVPNQVRAGVHATITLVRYGTAWPIFIARETLAAWDDGLALMLNLILGPDWQAVGFDEVRRSRRGHPG
jgi:hypothetical protein